MNDNRAYEDDYGQRRRMPVKRRSRHTLGKIMAMIQAVLSVVFLVLLLIVDVLPMTYVAIIFGVLLFLGVFAYVSQLTRGAHVIGKVDCIIMCVLLIIGNIYLFKTYSMLGNITSTTTKTDRIAVIVLNDDNAQSIADAKDYSFGIMNSGDHTKVDSAVKEINKNLESEIQTTAYGSYNDLIQALYDGSVEAVIYNVAYQGTIQESFTDFEAQVRELDNIEIKTAVETTKKSTGDVTKEPFTVYISGIDVYGDIDTTSRSDVNMLATINPTTKEILLTSIPRDYYVTIPDISGDSRDKLTHVGLYGVDASAATLENLFGITIDYTARVNFTTLIEMVDALGGIDVNSMYDFQTISGEYFSEGMNYGLSGTDALAFARERYNLPNGDNDRVIDQQAVLKGILDKLTSPAILTGYMGIMDSVSGSFQTSLSDKQISSLVKMQLGDGASWNIQSYAVSGAGDTQACYSSGDEALYVMWPDDDSVSTAVTYINQVLAGENVSIAGVTTEDTDE